MELIASSNSRNDARQSIPFPSPNFEAVEAENADINFNLMEGTHSANGRFKWPPQRGALLSALAIVAIAVALNCAILLIFWLSAVRQQTTADHQSTADKVGSAPCGSWTVAYRDAKCLKLFDQMETYDEAVKLCVEADPAARVLTIQTESEQAFIERLLFSQLRLFNPVWLDGHWDNLTGQFVTFGDHRLTFNNWAEGSPNRQDARSCIQLLAEHHTEEGNRGRWINVRCQAKGVVVCQRLQSWPLVKLQEGLLRAEIEADLQRQKLVRLEMTVEEADRRHQKELATVRDKVLIPVGFIYVQLPKEASPQEVWPAFSWKDVSGNYKNVFFRVVGERAAAFGSIQEASSPRLIGVKATDEASNSSTAISVQAGKWSEGLYVKAAHDQKSQPQSGRNDLKSLHFIVEGSEVRPKNMAIKIWKRVG